MPHTGPPCAGAEQPASRKQEKSGVGKEWMPWNYRQTLEKLRTAPLT